MIKAKLIAYAVYWTLSGSHTCQYIVTLSLWPPLWLQIKEVTLQERLKCKSSPIPLKGTCLFGQRTQHHKIKCYYPHHIKSKKYIKNNLDGLKKSWNIVPRLINSLWKAAIENKSLTFTSLPIWNLIWVTATLYLRKVQLNNDRKHQYRGAESLSRTPFLYSEQDPTYVNVHLQFLVNHSIWPKSLLQYLISD